MRRLVAILALWACGTPEATSIDERVAYLEDRAFRRAALIESLVNPDNGYSRRRLDAYAMSEAGDPTGWDALPTWNPAARPLVERDLGSFDGSPLRVSTAEEGELSPLAIEGVDPLDAEALIELGQRAFESYPVELDLSLEIAVRDEASLERFGLWADGRGRVGGLMRVRTADGGETFGVTCATCHGRVWAGELIHGPANTEYDRGGIALAEGREHGYPESALEPFRTWGPGLVDVTADDLDNPAAIPDLRAVRFQSHLHWAATLRNSLIGLAIRLETLIITSLGDVVRPPRIIALALATYLWSLAEGRTGAEGFGVELFETHCDGCHHADGSVGPPVPIDLVGTDSALGRSTLRGTGQYRVPSLWAVGDRGQLLHDASVESLEALLDPARSGGHEYGQELGGAQRDELLDFVRAIGSLR